MNMTRKKTCYFYFNKEMDKLGSSISDVKRAINDMHDAVIEENVGSNDFGSTVQCNLRTSGINRSWQGGIIVEGGQIEFTVIDCSILSKVGSKIKTIDDVRKRQLSESVIVHTLSL